MNRVEDFARSGALHLQLAASAAMSAIEAAIENVPEHKAGVRLFGVAGLKTLLASDGLVGSIAAGLIGEGCYPVRAVLFDKTVSNNWSLAWHQDRTIAVEDKLEVDGFGPWTVKGGVHHVAPPFDILSRLLTLRVHLDPVTPTNAPLLVAPGSHRLGRIAEPDIPKVVDKCGTIVCLAERGDVWLYSTPILHASEAASEAKGRRVLQVDYANFALPGGLEWVGV